MTKVLLILLAGLVFEAIGVVYLSAGMKQLNATDAGPGFTAAKVWRLVQSGATNRNILLGVFYEAIFFAALCYLLSQRDVSLIWPLSALSFVFTGVAAKCFLKEEISGLRWAGIVLIVIGAGVITWSEKVKDREAARRAAASLQLPP
jgi:drug/metabolite transporter (DMT)-like permease